MHVQVWQNNLAVLEAILADGVSADVPDDEAGW